MTYCALYCVFTFVEGKFDITLWPDWRRKESGNGAAQHPATFAIFTGYLNKQVHMYVHLVEKRNAAYNGKTRREKLECYQCSPFQ